MRKIKYKIKEYNNQIFVVVVPSSYTRAMLFLRVQEFYESSNKRFRNKSFSFWDYKEWYSSQNQLSFTYTKDWGGFNVPLKVAVKCKDVSEVETPYDKEMNKIINRIKQKAKNESYIIGVESTNSLTFMHEVAHALYHTDRAYRKEMDTLTSSLGHKKLNYVSNCLNKMGYCKKVVKDEVQAYISTEKSWSVASKAKIQEKIIKKYKNVFKEWYINLIKV